MGNDQGGAFPALRYRDANAAIEWLKEAFGASEHAVYRDDSGAVGHAEITVGRGMVMLGGAPEAGFLGSRGFDPWSSSISIYVVVDDPDAVYEMARAAGAEVVRELGEMDYGSREFSVRDPEGNLWSIGTYDPRTPQD